MEELTRELGITSVGVRRHMQALERDGLVATVLERRPKGRPTMIYRVTPDADAYFPKGYDRLATALLGLIAEMDGPAKVSALFRLRRDHLIEETAPRLRGMPLEERVQFVAGLLSADGYMAEVERLDERTFVLRALNCAISRVAQKYQQACLCELELLQGLLGVQVERRQHLVQGDSHCSYVITAAPSGAESADETERPESTVSSLS
ncbi:MAG: ArsR family transcriptional regulator [Deltaproteobacteria bacterium]|nr:ArsR family transcriptional regulator [Deltaproteobacteria bacterium]